MIDLSTIEAFRTALKGIRHLSELERHLTEITLSMGFDLFALVQHVDLSTHGTGQIIALSTYPSAWIEAYIEREMVSFDPVHLASHRTHIGFRWDDVGRYIQVTPAHRRIREATIRAGIGEGFTVPANIPGETNASCSFAMRVGRPLPTHALLAAKLVGDFAFEAGLNILRANRTAKPVPRLTPRQLECVIWSGRGKGDWETARILGIQRDTVTEHIEEAKRRFDVAKRHQVLIRAVWDGQIAMADVIE